MAVATLELEGRGLGLGELGDDQRALAVWALEALRTPASTITQCSLRDPLLLVLTHVRARALSKKRRGSKTSALYLFPEALASTSAKYERQWGQ